MGHVLKMLLQFATMAVQNWTINKSKIKDAIKAIFGHIPEAVNFDGDQKCTIGKKDRFTDFTFHTLINAISHNRDLCSIIKL